MLDSSKENNDKGPNFKIGKFKKVLQIKENVHLLKMN